MIEAVIERCAGIDVGKKFVVVCAEGSCQWGRAGPNPQVRHDQRRSGEVTRVAGELRLYARSDGEDGGVLEADLQRVGRDRASVNHPGEFAAGESAVGSLNRPGGCALAGAPVATRDDPAQLYSS